MPTPQRFAPTLISLSAALATVLLAAPARAQIFRPPIMYPAPYTYLASSDIRVKVKPKQTEVYVDGYYAGIVDDFDGVFQRLHVTPGPHEITFHLNGHHNHTERQYFTVSSTHKIEHTMVPLAAGDQPDPRPEPKEPPTAAQVPPTRGERMPPPRRSPPQRPEPPERPEPPQARAPRSVDQSRFGTLSIRVQPSNADIFIDGEKWQGPDAEEVLVVQLADGRHRVEVKKSGFRTYTGEIEITRGETTPLNVSLPPDKQ